MKVYKVTETIKWLALCDYLVEQATGNIAVVLRNSNKTIGLSVDWPITDYNKQNAADLGYEVVRIPFQTKFGIYTPDVLMPLVYTQTQLLPSIAEYNNLVWDVVKEFVPNSVPEFVNNDILVDGRKIQGAGMYVYPSGYTLQGSIISADMNYDEIDSIVQSKKHSPNLGDRMITFKDILGKDFDLQPLENAFIIAYANLCGEKIEVAEEPDFTIGRLKELYDFYSSEEWFKYGRGIDQTKAIYESK